MTPLEPSASLPVDAASAAAYEAIIAELRAQNAALLARVAELERRLGLNSSNSGKPPSSDGLKKPPRTSSLREPSGKPPGGQTGHPGKTLRQVEKPDHTVDHFPAVCKACGAALSEDAATGHTARQVFDLPEPQPLVVTEHRAHRCHCAACGTSTQAEFPKEVAGPVQYGPRIAAIVVYLMHYQFLPEQRLVKAMADLFGIHLVTATIASMSRAYAARFAGFVRLLHILIAVAPIKHLDETGFRIGGKTQWLHIASTLRLTLYRISSKRGSMPEGFTGIIVHDHWKPYYKLKRVVHALCNAHHLRELKALVDIEKEPWARQMQRLLQLACHATHLARAHGRWLSPARIALFERLYDRIIEEGMAYHQAQPALRLAAAGKPAKRGCKPKRTGHNLLVRLQTRKADVLRFLSNPDVPFTNNLAERDGRMMKLRQKISGGFRCEQGAKDFGTLRSLISTVKKQGWDVLTTLNENPETLASKLKLV